MSSEQDNYQEYLEILKELQENSEVSSQKSEESPHPNTALLTKEQIQMYEMLGISLTSFRHENQQLINLESENEKSFEEIPKQEPYEEDTILTSDDENLASEERGNEPQQRRSNEYNNQLVKNNEKELVPNCQTVETHENREGQSSNVNVVKRPFLRRGSGLTTRFGVSPETFNLKNLPPYKYNERVKKTLGRSSISKPEKENRRQSDPIIKMSEKSDGKEHQDEARRLNVPQNVELRKSGRNIPSPNPPQTTVEKLIKVCIEQPITETPKNNMKIPKSISWAQILSENNILSCPIDPIANNSLGNILDDTDLFHLLENKISENCSETSVADLMQLLANFQSKSNTEEDDDTLVDPDDPVIQEIPVEKKELLPRPEDIDLSQDESLDVESEDEGSQRVRFAKSVEICDENEGVSDLSTDLEAIELSQTSTPNERQKFEEFKKRMLGHKGRNEKELQQKSNQMKGKLSELESEIENLRSQTSQIAKMRQALELEKMQFENEREEFFQNADDEKVKVELFLHDERIKLENEKKKIKISRKSTSKKERDEIAKLKEQIESLTDEMKLKDSRHAAATARYRSQSKQFEKENQSLKLELEVMKKENKKLEFENARLRKDTNSKMLQEISRNIAKLAPSEQKLDKKSESKKPMRRSEPSAISKRTKSVPVLNKSSSDSSDEEDVDFKRKSTKENHPQKLRRSDPTKYQNSNSKSAASDVLSDMKREIVNADRSKDIWYPNGNLKKISADGMVIRMLYFNKDIKETNINEGTVKYYYHDTNTWHTTYIDGLEILEYPDGQTEHRYKNGIVEVHYQNGSIRVTNSKWTDDTKEEWKLPDGTNIRIMNNDTKILSFSNGQREIHTPNNKRREYPDGTVKIAYSDGSFETRYSNGRIRIKDNKGNLISDTVVH